MYSIVDRYDNERETWSKSRFGQGAIKHGRGNALIRVMPGRLYMRRKFIDCSILYSEFADFSTANKQQTDDFSDDDCRAFCIPPIDKNNFDKTHFLSMKFKYF
jgi:hypothetical protein